MTFALAQSHFKFFLGLNLFSQLPITESYTNKTNQPKKTMGQDDGYFSFFPGTLHGSHWQSDADAPSYLAGRIFNWGMAGKTCLFGNERFYETKIELIIFIDYITYLWSTFNQLSKSLLFPFVGSIFRSQRF